MCATCKLYECVGLAAEAAEAPKPAVRGFLFDIAGELEGTAWPGVDRAVHSLAHGVRHGRVSARFALERTSGFLLCMMLTTSGEA